MASVDPLSSAERVRAVYKHSHDLGDNWIAAIDFGTTYCSLAYSPPHGETVNLHLNHVFPRVPTAILLKKDGTRLKNGSPINTYTVARFGTHAQNGITTFGKKKDFLYFECFKMSLSNKKQINRFLKLKSMNGELFYFVEVVAFVLRYLKDELRRRCPLAEFDWVITVPAIWNAGGKQMMREAAYLAGIFSEHKEEGIACLTPVNSSQLPTLPEVENPYKLSLALEPESAALYCQQLDNDVLALYSDDPIETDSYMVCDIGGGTVDITAIKHSKGNFEVIIPPMGNDCGGKRLNEAFSTFLGKIVGDPDFSAFLQIPGKEAYHQAILTEMVDHNFEVEKQIFGDQEPNTEGSMCLMLNNDFLEVYRDSLTQGVETLADSRIEFDGDNVLQIQYSKLVELFEPNACQVTQCAIDALDILGGKVGMVYLVGGFGGCWYTFGCIKAALKSSYDIPLVVPKNFKLAVSLGAILFRKSPECIQARTMDCSYGLTCSTPFKKGIHDTNYKYRDVEDGSDRCKDVFLVYVRKGDKVAITDRFQSDLSPHSSKATTALFKVYCTTDRTIQYTKDKHDNPNVVEVGSLTLDIPNPNNLQRNDRLMTVTMDFSHTEIRVEAKASYLPTKSPVKAVLDFL